MSGSIRRFIGEGPMTSNSEIEIPIFSPFAPKIFNINYVKKEIYNKKIISESVSRPKIIF